MKRTLLTLLSAFLLFGLCDAAVSYLPITPTTLSYSYTPNVYSIDSSVLLPDHEVTCSTYKDDYEDLVENVNKFTNLLVDAKISCQSNGVDCVKIDAYTNAVEILNLQNTKLEFIKQDCVKAEQQYIYDADKFAKEGDSLFDKAQYTSAKLKYKDAANQLRNVHLVDVSESIKQLEQSMKDCDTAQGIKNQMEFIYDLEQKAYKLLQNEKYEKALDKYNEALSYEGEIEYDYSGIKANIKNIKSILKIQSDLEKAEEAKLQEEVERAKNALGAKAKVVESISKAEKLKKDKDLREKLIKLCDVFKASPKEFNKSYGIYLQYLLKTNY